MKKSFFILLLVLFSVQLFSQDVNVFFEKTDSFLKANVSNGKMDYNAIHSNPEQLNELMALAKVVSITKGNKNEYKAFWINAYNLSVIKGIIENYPLKSPLDLKDFFDSTMYNLAGKSLTLNGIENDILRAQFSDPRFHFVLVCGAIGCPPLINEVYLPKSLDQQLNQQTVLALNRNYFININNNTSTVQVSVIFKWYKEDFTKNGQSEIEYINQYRKEKIPTDYRLTYSTYDWNLNSK